MATTARDQFVSDVACPAERVSLTERARPRREPPADVAADPQRLQIWNRTEDERLAARPTEMYFVVTGCSQQRLYRCDVHRNNSNYCWPE